MDTEDRQDNPGCTGDTQDTQTTRRTRTQEGRTGTTGCKRHAGQTRNTTRRRERTGKTRQEERTGSTGSTGACRFTNTVGLVLCRRIVVRGSSLAQTNENMWYHSPNVSFANVASISKQRMCLYRFLNLFFRDIHTDFDIENRVAWRPRNRGGTWAYRGVSRRLGFLLQIRTRSRGRVRKQYIESVASTNNPRALSRLRSRVCIIWSKQRTAIRCLIAHRWAEQGSHTGVSALLGAGSSCPVVVRLPCQKRSEALFIRIPQLHLATS